MRSKKTVAALAVLVICVGVVALVAMKQEQAKGDHHLKVGVILPLTGILAEMGQYEKEAMLLGLEKLREAGHHKVELLFEDGKGDKKAVAAAANKLLDVDEVDILVTSTTGASLTAQPIAERHGAPQLAFCMSSEVASRSSNTVRFYIGIEEETAAIVEYLRQLPEDTRVGILHASVAVWATAVGDFFAPFLASHFKHSAVVEEYDLKSKDFRAQLTSLKNAGVQVLVVLGYGFEYGPLFSQMSELGLREGLNIVGGWGFLYTPLGDDLLEGIRVAGPMYVFRRGQAGGEFERAFMKEYGHGPNFDAAFAYEVIVSLPRLFEIIEQVPKTGLKPQLEALGTVKGVMGDYHFSSAGNMIVQTATGVFRDGQIVGQ